MRIRLTLIAGCLALGITGCYIASPLLAAYHLREAVVANDTRTIERMINWPSLRSSLRTTIAQNAKLLPVATRAAQKASTSWWQRIRSALGHSMLDRFVERYITPKGLPELYRSRTRLHGMLNKKGEPTSAQAGVEGGLLPQSLTKAWRRIKRAEFTSPFRFILVVQDRFKADRLIEATLHLTGISWRGFEWQLVAVGVDEQKPGKSHLARLNGF